MPTTIRDVAKAAGVSAATVSRVLNGKEDVGADLRRRVRTAATEPGYASAVLA
jgi:LacI family transcriptional regulator